jgi:hypothetical protein
MLQLMTPVVLTLCALWLVRSLYLWQRPASYRRRLQRRNAHPAEKLDTQSSGIKKPEQYDGGEILHEAQWTYLGRAVEAQGVYFANGILRAVLPPLALLLLSLQLLAVPGGGNWAIGLILSEVLCLGILIYSALTIREPTGTWIENRIRTELLRREQYLFLTGVGPYLGSDDSECFRIALQRRGQIEAADARTLAALVPMQEHSGSTWLEVLHQKGTGKLQGRSDCVERMESYLYHRVEKQLLWFANELRDCEENERLWSRLLTGALLAAIAVAMVHVLHLHGEHSSTDPTNGPGHWAIVIGALAIVLPPLSTACLGILAIYNFTGRIRTYGHEKGLLHAHRGRLEALVSKANGLGSEAAGSRELGKIDFEFRAAVLRTEDSLSTELEQWMLLMERREPEVAA